MVEADLNCIAHERGLPVEASEEVLWMLSTKMESETADDMISNAAIGRVCG